MVEIRLNDDDDDDAAAGDDVDTEVVEENDCDGDDGTNVDQNELG